MSDDSAGAVASRRCLGTAVGLLALTLALGGCEAERGKERVGTAGGAAHPPVALAHPSSATPSPSAPTSVSVGVGHACVTSGDGRAWCWGDNAGAQLGAVPDSESVVRPVRVESETPFVSVGAGGAHSCALSRDGAAWCWGANPSGQLGDGTARGRSRPLAVSVPARFTQVAVGISHSCALDATGAAWCWGANQVGQLGDGSTRDASRPVRVAGDARYRALGVGGASTCGLASGGAVWCWGASAVGRGEGSTSLRTTTPARVAELRDIASLSVGTHLTCAVGTDHTVWCAGDNSSGQLANGRSDDMMSEHPEPVAVTFPAGVTIAEVAAGEGHACALDSDGRAWCWGRGASGEIGDTTSLGRCALGTGLIPCAKHPVAVTDDYRFRAISTGTSESCGITRDERVVCWGGAGGGVREIVLPVPAVVSPSAAPPPEP
jgi:alpha-tubulin suppressor-like RCC1 family protein